MPKRECSDMNSPLPNSVPSRKRDEDVTENACLANARVVLEDRVINGSVTINQGSITAIEESSRVPAGAIDLAGDFLIPGLVELHTDNLERHIEPRSNVPWPHAPAILAHDRELASTGITTVFDAMRVGSILSGKGRYPRYARELSRELLELRTEGVLKISHFLHLRAEVCSETLLDELAEFGPEDRVGIVSLTDHTPGQRQFRDLSKMKTHVAARKDMNDQEFDDHVTRLRALRKRHGDKHEAMAIQDAKRLGAVLASHDDATAGQVAVSAAHGIRLAEFPTTVESAEACREAGMAIMMGGPNIIRGESHYSNVSALDLAKRGLLDIVSSDYVPSSLLLAAFRLDEMWQDLPRAIRCISQAPAQAAGLKDRGAISKGNRADLVRLRSSASTHAVISVWVNGQRVS